MLTFICCRVFQSTLPRGERLRSSADLTKEEMNASITRFKIWAAKEGIYLPEPEDADRLKEIEYLITKNEKYLKA